MAKLQFESLDPIKLPLVQRFYKQHYPSTKPKKNEQIIIARHEHEICAVVRFRPIESYWLLTGMAVAESQRGEGIGHQLLQYCQKDSLNNHVFCFAFSWLESFYQQAGFQTVDDEKLPNSLRMLFQRYQSAGKSLTPMQYQGKKLIIK